MKKGFPVRRQVVLSTNDRRPGCSVKHIEVVDLPTLQKKVQSISKLPVTVTLPNQKALSTGGVMMSSPMTGDRPGPGGGDSASPEELPMAPGMADASRVWPPPAARKFTEGTASRPGVKPLGGKDVMAPAILTEEIIGDEWHDHLVATAVEWISANSNKTQVCEFWEEGQEDEGERADDEMIELA